MSIAAKLHRIAVLLLHGIGFVTLRYVSVEFGGSRVAQAAQPFYFLYESECFRADLLMAAQACHGIREFTCTKRIQL
jgi:hypothetical protein